MKDSNGRIIVFPFHNEVDRFTLKGALRDAEVDVDEFLKVLDRDLLDNLAANVSKSFLARKFNLLSF